MENNWQPINPSDAPLLKKDKVNKKAYQRPQLSVYGNISEITRAVGKNGLADGAPGGTPTPQAKNKTQI